MTPAHPATASVRPRIPTYNSNPPPIYPQAARWSGEEGIVRLKVRVDRQGRASTVQLLLSSGFTSLDQAAEEAVRHWQFIPGSRDGHPAAMWIEVPIRFHLQDDDS